MGYRIGKGLGIVENRRVCAEIHKLFQNLAVVSPLGRAGVELSVGKSPCAPFAETVIGIRVQLSFAAKSSGVRLPGVDILPPFEYYRTEAFHKKPEGGKHSRRTRPHHDNAPFLPYIPVGPQFVADRLFPRLAAAHPFLKGYRDANVGTVPSAAVRSFA